MIFVAPQKKQFNRYKIIEDEDYVIIYLERKSGEVLETYIDLEDLDRLICLNYSWHTCYSQRLNSYYVKATETYRDESGKRKQRTIYLHRYIMNYDGEKFIDHQNHNMLDNRKSNLKIVDQSINMKNGSKLRKNNTSGEPNVNWSGRDKKWIIQFQVNKKTICFAKFPEKEIAKAIEYARHIRQEVYKPDFVQEGYNLDNLMFIQ